MRLLAPMCAGLLLYASQAAATEFRLPADKPTVRLTVSDDWSPEPNTKGLSAQTRDGEAFLTVALTGDAKEMDVLIDEADAMLKARKVKLDRSSRKNNKFKIGAFPSEELVYTGFDGRGPVVVIFTFVTVGRTVLVFTYRATKEGNEEHLIEVGQIFDSIKVIKPLATP